jgi:dephospho-CoA kinase
MLNLLKIAITGGIASGKSTVCRHFEKLGATVVSADAIVHELLDPNTALGQKIIRTLGSDVLRNGKIDRSLVSDKVFKDPKLLSQLEQLLHPAVLKEIELRYETARRAGKSPLFVVEIPLLYEIGAQTFYDAVVAVVAEESLAKERFQAAGHKPQEFEKRMNRQLPQKIKSAKAHYTIQNNGTLQDLYTEVEKLFATLNRSCTVNE